MQINSDRIIELRRQCEWSQDELATAAGLNLRTVQRVENAGTASMQTVKALAAALETDLADLKTSVEAPVTKYEYKMVNLPFKTGFTSQTPPDIAAALNHEACEGWRLSQVCAPIGAGGSTVSMIAILERPQA
jgi:transcriptional regulator with XRE-family HTH domain